MSQERINWQDNLERVDEIADALGKGIDPGVRETVAVFLAYNFPTSGSCEGHVAIEGEQEHGLPYPWIEIYSPEPSGWDSVEGETKKQIERDWRFENLKHQQKMLGLLERFYQGRNSPLEARLVFDRVGMFGGFRLQSFGADIVDLLPNEEKQAKLALFQEEMRAFTEFLKQESDQEAQVGF